MAAELKTTILSQLTGLGSVLEFVDTFTTTTTPTRKYFGYQVQATADTAEALNLGDVTTPELIVLKCVTNDVDIDTSYSVAFSAELTVNEGEVAVFKPVGTVYIRNDDAVELSTIEVLVVGT
jgi:hypothetical protein